MSTAPTPTMTPGPGGGNDDTSDVSVRTRPSQSKKRSSKRASKPITLQQLESQATAQQQAASSASPASSSSENNSSTPNIVPPAAVVGFATQPETDTTAGGDDIEANLMDLLSPNLIELEFESSNAAATVASSASSSAAASSSNPAAGATSTPAKRSTHISPQLLQQLRQQSQQILEKKQSQSQLQQQQSQQLQPQRQRQQRQEADDEDDVPQQKQLQKKELKPMHIDDDDDVDAVKIVEQSKPAIITTTAITSSAASQQQSTAPPLPPPHAFMPLLPSQLTSSLNHSARTLTFEQHGFLFLVLDRSIEEGENFLLYSYPSSVCATSSSSAANASGSGDGSDKIEQSEADEVMAFDANDGDELGVNEDDFQSGPTSTNSAPLSTFEAASTLSTSASTPSISPLTSLTHKLLRMCGVYSVLEGGVACVTGQKARVGVLMEEDDLSNNLIGSGSMQAEMQKKLPLKLTVATRELKKSAVTTSAAAVASSSSFSKPSALATPTNSLVFLTITWLPHITNDTLFTLTRNILSSLRMISGELTLEKGWKPWLLTQQTTTTVPKLLPFLTPHAYETMMTSWSPSSSALPSASVLASKPTSQSRSQMQSRQQQQIQPPQQQQKSKRRAILPSDIIWHAYHAVKQGDEKKQQQQEVGVTNKDTPNDQQPPIPYPSCALEALVYHHSIFSSITETICERVVASEETSVFTAGGRKMNGANHAASSLPSQLSSFDITSSSCSFLSPTLVPLYDFMSMNDASSGDTENDVQKLLKEEMMRGGEEMRSNITISTASAGGALSPTSLTSASQSRSPPLLIGSLLFHRSSQLLTSTISSITSTSSSPSSLPAQKLRLTDQHEISNFLWMNGIFDSAASSFSVPTAARGTSTPSSKAKPRFSVHEIYLSYQTQEITPPAPVEATAASKLPFDLASFAAALAAETASGSASSAADAPIVTRSRQVSHTRGASSIGGGWNTAAALLALPGSSPTGSSTIASNVIPPSPSSAMTTSSEGLGIGIGAHFPSSIISRTRTNSSAVAAVSIASASAAAGVTSPMPMPSSSPVSSPLFLGGGLVKSQSFSDLQNNNRSGAMSVSVSVSASPSASPLPAPHLAEMSSIGGPRDQDHLDFPSVTRSTSQSVTQMHSRASSISLSGPAGTTAGSTSASSRASLPQRNYLKRLLVLSERDDLILVNLFDLTAPENDGDSASSSSSAALTRSYTLASSSWSCDSQLFYASYLKELRIDVGRMVGMFDGVERMWKEWCVRKRNSGGNVNNKKDTGNARTMLSQIILHINSGNNNSNNQPAALLSPPSVRSPVSTGMMLSPTAGGAGAIASPRSPSITNGMTSPPPHHPSSSPSALTHANTRAAVGKEDMVYDYTVLDYGRAVVVRPALSGNNDEKFMKEYARLVTKIHNVFSKFTHLYANISVQSTTNNNATAAANNATTSSSTLPSSQAQHVRSSSTSSFVPVHSLTVSTSAGTSTPSSSASATAYHDPHISSELLGAGNHLHFRKHKTLETIKTVKEVGFRMMNTSGSTTGARWVKGRLLSSGIEVYVCCDDSLPADVLEATFQQMHQ